MKQSRVRAAAMFCSLAVLTVSGEAQPRNLPLDAASWRVLDKDVMGTKGQVEFERKEGFPDGLMVLKAGTAELTDVVFSNGSIDYDFKPLAEDIPGIQFRVQGDGPAQNGEEVYERISGDERASNDGLQYTPIIHGFLLWNVYPQYQCAAPLINGWNHVRLVVSGPRLAVYINHSDGPVLSVDNLRSRSLQGRIRLRGPAIFANLVVNKSSAEIERATRAVHDNTSDAGVLRSWRLAETQTRATSHGPEFSDAPSVSSVWHDVTAEEGGLVNLNREFYASEAPAGITWLKTTVRSGHDLAMPVSLGWVGQVWVFVNGKLTATGRNFYYPESERRQPDGRMSFENGSFLVPLRAGKNEITIALFASLRKAPASRTRYGWGLMMRFNDPKRLTFKTAQ